MKNEGEDMPMTAIRDVEERRAGQGTPTLDIPSLSCDCHMHIFGPLSIFPYDAGRIYTPPEASIGDYLAMRERLGLERVVLVQPSVYGTDNRCHMDAMAKIPGARGVAVIDGDESDAELERLDKAGFRGARINLMQGSVDAPIETVLERFGARLRDIDWHLQIFTKPEMLSSVAPILMRFPVPVMLDHFADLSPWQGPSQPGFELLRRLLTDGPCSVKLSAAYHHPRREQAGGPDNARRFVATLVKAAPERLVWGSNWPHPNVTPRTTATEAPTAHFRKVDDIGLLALLRDWVPDKATLKQILVDNPAKFYDF
jgi:predicted TIM-barrel fold metal-dependent hydrolase